MSLVRSRFYKYISGIVCLYKPAGVGLETFKTSFCLRLCQELNNQPNEKKKSDHYYLEFSENDTEEDTYGDIKPDHDSQCVDIKLNYELQCADTKSYLDTLRVDIKPSYKRHELVVGPRFRTDNVIISMTTLGKRTSGVCVTGINNSFVQVKKFERRRPLLVFQVKGKLGEARRDYCAEGKVTHRAPIHRVKKETIDELTSFMESAYQRNLYKNLGIDLRTEEAYELAASGNLDAQKHGGPCLYSIKCIDFNPPEFTLEIACLSISEVYLMKLIHLVGLKLKVFAYCTGVRCVRYGQFNVGHSMVKGEWTLENIIDNMRVCKGLMYQNNQFQGEEHLCHSTV